MKGTLVTAVALFSLVLSGCARSGSSSGNSMIPPVLANTAYSTASVTGTYSFNSISIQYGAVTTGIGSVTFDGNGKITGGTVNRYENGALCTASETGTYSINSDAVGIATVNLSSSTNGCTFNSPLQLALQASQAGEVLQFVETDNVAAMSGSAFKQ